MARPVILDFDRSVQGIAGATSIELSSWQEDIRFGCTMRRLKALGATLARTLPARHPIVFLGSGDFHHVSHLLIELACEVQPVEVIVIDNHPDNMRFPFGIHCGSWVRRVCQLPNVQHVHVLGITSADVSAARLWENYHTPLLRGRLTYWCIGAEFQWAHRLPWRSAFRTFPNPGALLDAFHNHQADSRASLYVTIDKDVLSPSVVRTNWDQGVLSEQDLHAAIDMLGNRIVACDITGEVSSYSYRHAWKRWLAARDSQPAVAAQDIASWQRQHFEINERLLSKLTPRLRGFEAITSASTATMRSN
jgi:hypothetical protein